MQQITAGIQSDIDKDQFYYYQYNITSNPVLHLNNLEVGAKIQSRLQ